MISIGMGIMGPGYFNLPEGIKMFCPGCGREVNGGDKGKSLKLEFSDDNCGFKINMRCIHCGTFNVNPLASKPTLT
jgi:hypothetical protein